MKAALLHRPKDLRIEEIPKPSIRDDEVLVAVKVVGVCGSDVHYYKQGRIGDQILRSPIVPGHEFSGVIEEVGKRVTSLAIGDRVAVEPGLPCRICEDCRKGRYNTCRNMRFCGTPPTNGAYLEYFACHEDFAFKLPEGMSLEEGAMLEPFAVGLHAVEIAPLVPGATVAVIGCGPIGLFAIQSAKASGATRIIASDLLDYRLVAARRFGATRTVNARHDSIVKAVLEETGGRGSSLSIEAAGASETVQEALDCTMPSGTVVWGGIPREDQVPINPHEARRKELVVRMLRRFCFTYPRAIEVASKGLVDLKSVVTHRFSLDRVAEAFELVSNYADGVIRAVITI